MSRRNEEKHRLRRKKGQRLLVDCARSRRRHSSSLGPRRLVRARSPLPQCRWVPIMMIIALGSRWTPRPPLRLFGGDVGRKSEIGMTATIVLCVLLSAGVVGCAHVDAGLANAPALGGAQVGPGRVQDAITNGLESCERRIGGSPLRGHTPPCPDSEPPPPPSSRTPLLAWPTGDIQTHDGPIPASP